jgi:hypothetical protein
MLLLYITIVVYNDECFLTKHHILVICKNKTFNQKEKLLLLFLFTFSLLRLADLLVF